MQLRLSADSYLPKQFLVRPQKQEFFELNNEEGVRRIIDSNEAIVLLLACFTGICR
jgi:hypothetical protein